jgi:hypothetical protein
MTDADRLKVLRRDASLRRLRRANAGVAAGAAALMLAFAAIASRGFAQNTATAAVSTSPTTSAVHHAGHGSRRSTLTPPNGAPTSALPGGSAATTSGGS